MSHCATLFIQVKKKKRNLTEIKSLSFKRDLTNWIKDTLSGWLLDKENESPQHISPHRCIPLDIRSYSHEKNTPFFFLDHIIWAYNLGLQFGPTKGWEKNIRGNLSPSTKGDLKHFWLSQSRQSLSSRARPAPSCLADT